MILINCPYCGEREQSEFSNGGEAHVARPENSEQIYAQVVYIPVCC